MAKKRIMRTFKLHEISAVDRPAQEGATAVLLKRKGSPNYNPCHPNPRKRGSADDGVTKDRDHVLHLLTSVEDGHAHILWLWPGNSGGETSHGHSPDEEVSHSHPWIMDAEGNITIAMDSGHDHVVANDALVQALMASASSRLAEELAEQLGKSDFSADDVKELIKGGALQSLLKAAGESGTEEVGEQEDIMPDDKTSKKDKDALKEAQDKSEALEAQLAQANAMASLTDTQKAYLNTLDEKLDDDKRAEFLAKSSEERDAIVDAVETQKRDSESVVYTATDGTVYTKSDDTRLVSQAKRNDELAKELRESKDVVDKANLRKRAKTELSNLPGTIETRMSLLKAADGIEDEKERTAAIDALKAQNAAMASAFDTNGHGAEPNLEDGGAEDQLNKLAKKHAEDKGVTLAQAVDVVSQTPEGAALYKQLVDEVPAVH